VWSRNTNNAVFCLLPFLDIPIVHVFLVALYEAFYNKVISLPLQTDPNTAFLRAARAGQQDKVIEYLDAGVDINTANAVSEFYNGTWTVQHAWASTILGRVTFMPNSRTSVELIWNSLVLLNPKINHHTHRRRPLYLVVIHLNQVHIFTSAFSNIYF